MMRMLCTLGLTVLFTNVNARQSDSGEDLLAKHRYEAAEIEFHQQLQEDPANEEAWLGLSRAYLLQGKNRSLLDTLEKAPDKAKDEYLYRIARAGALMANGQESEAMQIFEDCIAKTKSKNAEVLKSIARWHVELDKGNPEQAIALLNDAGKRAKKDPEVWFLQGKAYRKLHKGTEAYQAFREALDKKENYAPAYYELGRIFQTQKNADVYTDYFEKAVNARPDFAPALYELYEFHLYKSPARAREYYQAYLQNADPALRHDYEYTDLLYLNKKYDSAIQKAQALIQREGEEVQPRLFKLIAYSQQELNDSLQALEFMRRYFQNEADSNLLVKDFETMGYLFSSNKKIDSSIYYFAQAADRSEDSVLMRSYLRQLAFLAKQTGDPSREALWLGKYYNSDPAASNLTLFNWGLAAYKAQDFSQADTVFALYAEKYPEQGYGYYWRARSNAAIDSTMELGLAVPHYQQLITQLDQPLDSLSSSDRKWLVEANMYLASYATNTEKDYPAAVGYFQKVLALDPNNGTAAQYIDILEKNIKATKAAGSTVESNTAETEESSVPAK